MDNTSRQTDFSVGIAQERTQVFSLSPRVQHQSTLDTLRNKVICTREHYKHPALDKLIAQKVVSEIEISSQTEMFTLLLKGRCPLVYLPAFRARWYLKQFGKGAEVYAAPDVLDEVPLRLAFVPAHRAFVVQLNRYIKQLQQQGEMMPMLEGYLE